MYFIHSPPNKWKSSIDDGVKVNYNKFGAALKKITGLTVKK